MALMDDTGDNKDFINALTYLGKGPYNIGMPGGSDISVGAGPAPAPGVNVGTFGQRFFGGGPVESGAVGAGGSSGGADIIGLIQNALKFGGQGANIGSKLTATGQPGGADILKDMGTSGELSLGADTGLQGLGTELPNTALGTTPDMAGLLKELQGTLGSSSLEDPTLSLGGAGIGGGADSGLSSGLGTGAAGAAGAGGVLNMEEAIRSLLSGTGSPSGAAGQLGMGALSTYQSLSTLFPDTFPSISSLLGETAGAGGAAGAAGAEAGAAAGEAAAGAGAGAGGATSAGLAAAGPWLSVAAPVIIGLLGNMQANEAKAAMRQEGRTLRRQLGPAEEQAALGEQPLSQFDIGNAGAMDPAMYEQFLQAAAPGFRSMDPTTAPATGGVNYPMGPLQNIANLANANDPTGASKAQAESLFSGYPGAYERMVYSLMQDPNAAIPSPHTGGAQDWFSMLPGTPDPRTLTMQDPSGLTMPTAEGQQYGMDLLSSPEFASQYWARQGVTGPEAFLYGTGQEMGATGLSKLGLPSAENLGGYNPADLYKSLLAQGMPDLAGGPAALAAPTGAASVAPNQPGQPLPDVYQDLLKQYGMA